MASASISSSISRSISPSGSISKSGSISPSGSISSSISPSGSVSPSGSISPSGSVSPSSSASVSPSPSAEEKAYALTTAARLAAFMGITTPTGASLAVFKNIINSTTEFIENYIGRRIKETTYTNELYDTERSETLNLKSFPVNSTSAFTLERRTSADNTDDWETVDSQYYHIDYASGILEGASGLRFSRTTKGYRVTYTAGYDFDNSLTFLSDTEAGDIELVAWMLSSSIWNRRKGGASGEIQSERIGDYAVTYRASLLESADIKSILDKYAGIGDGVGVIGPLTPIQA